MPCCWVCSEYASYTMPTPVCDKCVKQGWTAIDGKLVQTDPDTDQREQAVYAAARRDPRR